MIPYWMSEAFKYGTPDHTVHELCRKVRKRKMSLWKNLKFVLSDEMNGLLHLLSKNYNKRSLTNEKDLHEALEQLDRILDSQDAFLDHSNKAVNEVQESRTDLAKVITQCDAVAERCEDLAGQCDAVLKQVDAIASKEPEITSGEIERIVSEAVAKPSERTMQQYQILSARLKEIYQLIDAQNHKDGQPDVNELLARIDVLEQENASYKSRLSQIEEEFEQAKSSYLEVSNQYKEEKRKTFDLSKRLVQADDKIKLLSGRIKDQALEDMLIVKGKRDPFTIDSNRDRYLITVNNLSKTVAKFSNMAGLNSFFESVPDNDPYKKMYAGFVRGIRNAAAKVSSRDDIGNVLNSFVAVVQNDLVNKLIVAVYRGMKNKKSDYEEQMLAAINQYLESVGFYSRNIQVGELLKKEDYEDMEVIKGERSEGMQRGEITEIELYPYYINYVDKGGRQRSVHTHGMMTVCA